MTFRRFWEIPLPGAGSIQYHDLLRETLLRETRPRGGAYGERGKEVLAVGGGLPRRLHRRRRHVLHVHAADEQSHRVPDEPVRRRCRQPNGEARRHVHAEHPEGHRDHRCARVGGSRHRRHRHQRGMAARCGGDLSLRHHRLRRRGGHAAFVGPRGGECERSHLLSARHGRRIRHRVHLQHAAHPREPHLLLRPRARGSRRPGYRAFARALQRGAPHRAFAGQFLRL